jgi:hypothetical protein
LYKNEKIEPRIARIIADKKEVHRIRINPRYPHCNPSGFARAAQIFKFVAWVLTHDTKKMAEKWGAEKWLALAGTRSFFCPPFFCLLWFRPKAGPSYPRSNVFFFATILVAALGCAR